MLLNMVYLRYLNASLPRCFLSHFIIGSVSVHFTSMFQLIQYGFTSVCVCIYLLSTEKSVINLFVDNKSMWCLCEILRFIHFICWLRAIFPPILAFLFSYARFLFFNLHAYWRFSFHLIVISFISLGFHVPPLRNNCTQVSWIRRRDFQLLTVGLSTYSSDDRFLVEHARHMGHWSLRIKSVRDDDKGLYECQLSVHPTQSIFVELKVVGKFSLSFFIL